VINPAINRMLSEQPIGECITLPDGRVIKVTKGGKGNYCKGCIFEYEYPCGVVVVCSKWSRLDRQTVKYVEIKEA